MLFLEHGKPMIFGKERNKGIRINGLKPEVVEIGVDGITEADLLVHDETREDPTIAFMLSRMSYPEYAGADRRHPRSAAADVRRADDRADRSMRSRSRAPAICGRCSPKGIRGSWSRHAIRRMHTDGPCDLLRHTFDDRMSEIGCWKLRRARIVT